MTLAAMAFLYGMYCYGMLACWKHNFKTYAGIRDRQLSFLLSLGALSNAFSRVLSGLLLQKLSFKNLYTGVMTVIVLTAFSFDWVIRDSESTPVAACYLLVAFAGVGTMMTAFPVICVKVFGSKVGGQLYPCIYLCFALSNLSAYTLYLYTDSPGEMFNILGCLALAGGVCGCLFNDTPNWRTIEKREKELGLDTLRTH